MHRYRFRRSAALVATSRRLSPHAQPSPSVREPLVLWQSLTALPSMYLLLFKWRGRLLRSYQPFRVCDPIAVPPLPPPPPTLPHHRHHTPPSTPPQDIHNITYHTSTLSYHNTPAVNS